VGAEVQRGQRSCGRKGKEGLAGENKGDKIRFPGVGGRKVEGRRATSAEGVPRGRFGFECCKGRRKKSAWRVKTRQRVDPGATLMPREKKT